MLDKPPTEPQWLSWVYAGIGALLIFLVVPFARAAQAFVTNAVGREFFLYAVAFAAIVAGLVAFASLRKRNLGVGAYLCLLGVGAAFAIYIYRLREIPEEAIHFIQYGVLSLLVYRALVHRVRDYSVYVTATVIVGTVGVVDEWIQWMTPSRIWDLRDIRTNVIAGGLMQLAIVSGLRPSIVAHSPNATSLQMLFRVAAMGSLLLGLTLVNTPEMIARYTSAFPALSFIVDNKRVVMVEYGYMHRDPEIGLFRSRFTKGQLERYDKTRGAEVANVMDELVNEENFSIFLRRYNVIRDPYVHEAGVHLFRRNRYLLRAESEPEERNEHLTIAFQENRILELYFPTVLALSKHVWTDGKRNQVGKETINRMAYESRVSRGLITRFSEQQVRVGLGVWFVALLLLARFFERRAATAQRAPGMDGTARK